MDAISASRTPLLEASGVSKSYGARIGCINVSVSVGAGEVLGVVGESGSGKSTLMKCLSGQITPDEGAVVYRGTDREPVDVFSLSEMERRRLHRTDWGFVHQNPLDGLHIDVSAGGNVGEALMSRGVRNYGAIRASAQDWLEKLEIDPSRVDDRACSFSGGMLQRLQVARNFVAAPRLVFMDEPTGGLDASVQARLLDVLRTLVRELAVAVIIVTHDLAVVRLLADRLIVMHRGRVIEEGLTDRVLDDPREPYTQLLVSSVLQI